LDDLKKQAEAKKAQESEASKSRDTQFIQNFPATEEKLKVIYKYADELAKTLNEIKPDVRHQFFLDGHGVIKDVRQEEYKVSFKNVTLDHIDHIKEIQLKFQCSLPEKLEIQKPDEASIARYKDMLWKTGLKFDLSETRNERGLVEKGVFTLEKNFFGGFLISGDYDKGEITFKWKNFANFGVKELVFDHDEIDQHLLDEFGKFLIVQPSEFPLLGRRQAALRAMIEKRKQQKDINFENTTVVYQQDRPSSTEQSAEEKKPLLGKIKDILNKPIL
jgi:hypothetical protein